MNWKERKLIDTTNSKHPNKSDSELGYLLQGREYYKQGIQSKYSAKYPNDTWVGSFRLLGWHLEKENVKPDPTIQFPKNVEVGAQCLFDGVKHQIYAFGDGMLLLSPINEKHVYHDIVVPHEKVTEITPRRR